MPKPRGNIGTLPLALREQINAKLRDNQETYEKIATWLLGQPIEGEGFPVSTIYDGTKNPLRCCMTALGRWFQSKHYERWMKDAAMHDDVLRRVRNIETRISAVGDDGEDRFMKGMVLEGMEILCRGEADSKDIFMLCTAYCNLRGLKKGDVQATEINAKLEKLAAEVKASREKGKPIDSDERKAILDKVDEILLGGPKK